MPKRVSIPKLKEKMHLKDFNASRLALESKLSDSTIDRILHNRANRYSDYTLNRLAIALDCTVLELLDDESASASLTAFSSHTVENAVAEAAAENVTAVVEAVAPDVPPEVVAENMPVTPVSVPSAMDVAVYFERIKEQHSAEVAGLQEHLRELRAERGLWRWLCLGLGVLFVALSFWKGVF